MGRGGVVTRSDRMKDFAVRRARSVFGWLRGMAYEEYEKLLEDEIVARKLPGHVAIIMDGNRRYARKLGISTERGYYYGAEITERVIEWCFDTGVKQLTLYAFSIENFNRSEEEKEKLFGLLRTEFEKLSVDERMHKNEVRMKAIGNVNLLPESVRAAIRKAEQATAHYTRYKLFIAVAYSGRLEIVDAVRIIASRVKKGSLTPAEITKETISRHLYISQIEGEDDAADSDSDSQTSVDLIIRTGGEVRISNFVPWQALGNECAAYFCAPFWPEFRRVDLLRAIRTYQEREEERQQCRASRILLLKRLLDRKASSKEVKRVN
ncbi:MAG: di-trans,poly-cis-decaprenylcistransferase [Methanomicrobia archaeon]|nr:di-trans,poly-cis-decaprenylcistransferase [Methanomicrobia archaeon]